MIVQKYIVLLGERHGKQIWLAYNDAGRISNANYSEAFQYNTHRLAEIALRRVRRTHSFPDAKILGTTVEIESQTGVFA